MNFTDQAIVSYAERHTTAGPNYLETLERKTQLEVMRPRMLSGHLQGRLLALISRLVHPKFILEIGTYTGYSALCLAEGLAPGGKVITLENNDELEGRIRQVIHSAGMDDRIELKLGDATEIIPGLKEQFDLVFIDADKENYCRYYEMTIGKVRPGGLILADNVLWSGKVLQPESNMDEETKAIHAFNQMVASDQRVEGVLVPVRDGIFVIRKR